MSALMNAYTEHPKYPPTRLQMSPILYGWFIDRMRERGEPPIFQGIKPEVVRDMDGFAFVD
jgi:hypothetical protein